MTSDISDNMRASFNQYTFIGWMYVCITNQHVEAPDQPDPDAGPWLADLGDSGFGWRFDVACRRGWTLLCEDPESAEWARDHVLPLCSGFLRDCLLGAIVSKGV